MPQADVAGKLPALLEEMQKDMYDAAKQRLKANTVLANSIEEVESILNDVTAEKGGGKFVMAHLKDDPALRRAHERIQGHDSLHSSSRRIRRPGQMHRHRRRSGSTSGDRESILTTRGTQESWRRVSPI